MKTSTLPNLTIALLYMALLSNNNTVHTDGLTTVTTFWLSANAATAETTVKPPDLETTVIPADKVTISMEISTAMGIDKLSTDTPLTGDAVLETTGIPPNSSTIDQVVHQGSTDATTTTTAAAAVKRSFFSSLLKKAFKWPQKSITNIVAKSSLGMSSLESTTTDSTVDLSIQNAFNMSVLNSSLGEDIVNQLIRHSAAMEQDTKYANAVNNALDSIISLSQDLSNATTDDVMDVADSVMAAVSTGVGQGYLDIDLIERVLTNAANLIKELITQNGIFRIRQVLNSTDEFTAALAKVFTNGTDIRLSTDQFEFVAEILDMEEDYSVTINGFNINIPKLGSGKSSILVSVIREWTTETGSEGKHIQATPILSINMQDSFSSEQLLYMDFIHNETNEYMVPICVYMDKDSDNLDWLIDGMKTLPLNKTATRCFSNHLTNFAVLMQISDLEISDSDRQALNHLSKFGCSVSIICLLISFILLVLSRLQTDKVFVLKNMVFMMFWAQMLFLTGVDKTHLPMVCKVIAVLLHYLFLAVIMWMFSQGIQLYMKVSYITSQASHWIAYTLISYAIPAVIVAISLIKSHRNYGYSKYCWLAPSEGLMFAFVGPALFVLIVNVLVLLRVLKTFNSVQINARKSDQDKFKASVRACFVLLPLLGTSWILGVFALDNTNTVFFQYLFILLNMLKGILVLVFHVLLNDDVTSVVFKKYGCRRRGKVVHISDKPGTKSSGLSPVDATVKTTQDRYSLFLVKSLQKNNQSKSDNLKPNTSSRKWIE